MAGDQPYCVQPLYDGRCATCGAAVPSLKIATGVSVLLFCPPVPGVTGTWGVCVEAYLRARRESHADVVTLAENAGTRTLVFAGDGTGCAGPVTVNLTSAQVACVGGACI